MMRRAAESGNFSVGTVQHWTVSASTIGWNADDDVRSISRDDLRLPRKGPHMELLLERRHEGRPVAAGLGAGDL